MFSVESRAKVVADIMFLMRPLERRKCYTLLDERKVQTYQRAGLFHVNVQVTNMTDRDIIEFAVILSPRNVYR